MTSKEEINVNLRYFVLIFKLDNVSIYEHLKNEEVVIFKDKIVIAKLIGNCSQNIPVLETLTLNNANFNISTDEKV